MRQNTEVILIRADGAEQYLTRAAARRSLDAGEASYAGRGADGIPRLVQRRTAVYWDGERPGLMRRPGEVRS